MKTGWIIQKKDPGWFVKRSCEYTLNLKKALVFGTRQEARDAYLPFESEVVRKVELYAQGSIKKIIPGR